MILSGPGYSVDVPFGFTLFGQTPIVGFHWLLPPGSSQTPVGVPAILQIRPVEPNDLPGLLTNLYNFENPFVAQVNAANLGLSQVIGIAPTRQVGLLQGTAHIRELNAINVRGFTLRVMIIVIQGPQSAVEVAIWLDLFRWVEFTAACLDFVGRIRLAGNNPATTPQLRAVIDQNHTDQIEYQFVSQNNQTIPLTSMPTTIRGRTIINAQQVILTGDINGTGIAIGDHTIARVS